MKMPSLGKLVFACAMLSATIIGSNAQTQHVRSANVSSGNFAILCQPGLVFRCNQFGCFCVKP
jgi:hypothetical protein